DRVREAGCILIFFETILVGGHALELKRVLGSEISVAFNEGIGIEQVFDPVLGRLRKVMVAMRANALVPRELDLVHDLRTARAFLPESLRHLAFFARLLEGWSFENGHIVRRARRSPRARRPRPLVAGRARIRSASSR